MQEAKFSANIKFRHLGFECQFTQRADEGDAAHIMELQLAAVKWLWQHGATPSNGGGQPAAKKEQELVCPTCGKADELELIKFERDGKKRQAWKCQRCKKWLPGNGS